MAKIIGNTLISDNYATTRIMGPPDRPDKTQAERDAERRADRIGLSELCREFKATVEEIDLAIALLGFPTPIGRKAPKLGMFGMGETIYSRSDIARWRADRAPLARKFLIT